MARFRDANWELSTLPSGACETWEQAAIAVLMDIRQRLNVLQCSDFQGIPRVLTRIAANTARPRRVSAHERHRRAVRRARSRR